MRWKRCGGMLAEWSLAFVLIAGGLAGWDFAGSAGWGQTGAASAIATTTVTDTVYWANGTPASGTVLISWPAFVTAGGSNIPAGETTVTLGTNGLLSVALVPNSGSIPMGSYYTVVYHLADGSVTRQYWVVPALAAGGATSVKVGAISASVLPASVAMQTVSKSYVDQAIAAAETGAPLDASPYVVKTGDTMTGPLVLPGDPVAPLQAAEKQYVDEQVASVGGGVGQKVSELPQATQVVAQPAGTDLAVNNLNGALYASQYVTGAGNNGIANAAASPDCTTGCDLVVEHSYPSTETVKVGSLNSATRVEDRRNGRVASTTLNPLNTASPGDNTANAMDLASTRSAASLFALNGATEQFGTTLKLTNEALAGGANVFPQNVQSVTPYFKSTYSALSAIGTSYTPGQHILSGALQTCYSVGDCLMGSQYMVTSGGLRDDADEGSHPFDLNYSEDTEVFTGSCSTGCTAGSAVVNITPSAFGGTQGEGRYLIDTTPSKVISAGTLIGGSLGALQAVASFSGTNFPVSIFLQTGQAIPPQANNIAPGTVTVAIVTSSAPAGYASSTAALPASSGVACVAGQAAQLNTIVDFETAPYTVIDSGHLQLTLTRPHQNGATVAVGGLCGYGLEQKVDTTAGLRQVFPVIGSPTSTTLNYAAGSTPIVGVSSTSGYINLDQVIAAIARSGNTVTITTAGNLAQDFNGLPLTVQGVADASYNGTFTVTSTSGNTLTYAQSGANSTSSGGTVSYVTGGYALYPMAEVVNVYNTQTRAVDGQMTLAANTVNWAAGDTVEEPHYFQQRVSADLQYVTQYAPRPSLLQSAGIQYLGNNGVGLTGWSISNNTPASAYFGAGGTHQLPDAGMSVGGAWKTSLSLEAGAVAALAVSCNLHGCGRWNSNYNLFELASNNGTDSIGYAPQSNTLSFSLAGTGYAFTPQGFTAGTINATQLNASTISGQFTGTVSASALPVFGASGSAHSVGAVPDPGVVAGTSRYLREDGSWVAPPTGSGGSGGATFPSSGLVYATSAATSTAATSTQVQTTLGAGVYLPSTSTVQVNEYPYTAACNGSTDDSTTINAALASGASVVKLPPNGVTCAIAHQLVMPSNTKLDLSGATLVDTSSTGYVITNASAIASAVQTQTNCAVTSGSATLTCTGGNMTALTLPASVIVTNGAYGCSSFNSGNGSCSASGAIPLVTWITAVSSATVATMYQAASNTASATTAAFYTRDSGIEVSGGTLTRATGSSGTSNVFFQNADRVSAHNLYFTGAAVGYNLFFENATYIDAEHLKFNRTGANSDGVHLDGPLLHGIVRDIGGATCDNMVAITGQDTYAGVVDDVLIDKVSGTSCGLGLVIAAGAAGALMNNITISNVQAFDVTTAPPVLVRSFNSAFVRNVQTALSLSTDTVGTVLVQGANDANGTLVVENAKLNITNAAGYSGATTYRAVTLENTSIAPVGGSTHYLQGGGPGTTTINTFTANNLGCNSSSAGSCEFFGPPSNLSFGSFIGKGLALTSANTGQSDYFGSFTGNTIGNLNVQFTATGSGMAQLWQLNSGTSISSMTLDAAVLANSTQISFGGGYNSTWVVGVNSGATVGTLGFTHADVRYMQGLFYLDAGSTAPSAVNISNAYLANDNRGLGEADKAVTINLNSVQNISGVNEALINCAANTITVLGVNYSATSNQASFTDCGSTSNRARINVSGGFPVNLGNSSVAASLAPSTGDVIYDTNSSTLKYWNSAAWVALNSSIFQEVLFTPSSSSASCAAGQFTDDAGYHYVCTAANTWKRVALTTF